MCLSLIKKITKIDKGVAYVDGAPVQLMFEGASVGDSVLVYGNLAMRKVSAKEAMEVESYGV